jgi:hypothetical protein
MMLRADASANVQIGYHEQARLQPEILIIIDISPCYQVTADFLEPPFSVDQVVALIGGRIPGESL